jgi:hypothetical protein
MFFKLEISQHEKISKLYFYLSLFITVFSGIKFSFSYYTNTFYFDSLINFIFCGFASYFLNKQSRTVSLLFSCNLFFNILLNLNKLNLNLYQILAFIFPFLSMLVSIFGTISNFKIYSLNVKNGNDKLFIFKVIFFVLVLIFLQLSFGYFYNWISNPIYSNLQIEENGIRNYLVENNLAQEDEEVFYFYTQDIYQIKKFYVFFTNENLVIQNQDWGEKDELAIIPLALVESLELKKSNLFFQNSLVQFKLRVGENIYDFPISSYKNLDDKFFSELKSKCEELKKEK